MVSRSALAISAALLSLSSYANAQGGPPSYHRDDRRYEQPKPDRVDQFRAEGKTIVIGEKRSNHLEDRIVFRITPDTPPTSDLSIRVSERPILIEAIELSFADGSAQRAELFERIRPDAPSSSIPVDISRGPLRQVTIWKRPSWRPNEQLVQLMGKVRPPPPRPSTAEPRVIQRVTTEAMRESVRFELSRDTPPLKSLSLRSPNRRLLVQRIDLEFGNGERKSFDVMASLDVGSSLPTLDLGAPRALRSVTIWKRPNFRPGPLELELIGQPAEPRRQPPRWGGVGNAIPRGWLLLGTQAVAMTRDLDTITIGREVGRFSRLALRVHEQAVDFDSLTIVYTNGQRDVMSIETTIPAGAQTKPIDLASDRFIDRIELTYVSKRNRENESAIVEVYGDFADDWLKLRDRERPARNDWLMLGAQNASMFATDRDALIVGERFGRLKSLRLKAKRSSIRIYSAEVFYKDGSSLALPLSTVLRDGEESQIIDLGPRPRVIERVVLNYRSKLGSRGAGLLEIWGQR